MNLTLGMILLGYVLLSSILPNFSLTLCLNNFLVNFITVSFKVDFNLFFVTLVLFISVMILIYSFYYMETSENMVLMYSMMGLFVISMEVLILSNSGVSLFIGWDGLGVTSYFLVVFYTNWKSNNSGMVTILSNRVGDSFLMVWVCYSLIFLTNSTMFFLKSMAFWSSVIFILLCFTKSAQFPFSTWLPVAMSAPTPISALVHSSTLVTAGVWLFIRFFNSLNMDKMWLFVLVIGGLTLLHSGVFSLIELDLKKIVALSTLNQLSLMVISLSTGLKMLTYMHLSTHAAFKSLLFLVVGVFLHIMFSHQDSRVFSLSIKWMKMLSLMFIMSGVSLMGVTFTSGFFSKDIILESILFYKGSIFITISIFMMMGFTFIYTTRVFMTMVCSNLKSSCSLASTPLSVYAPMMTLSVFTLLLGKVLVLNLWGSKFVLLNTSSGKVLLPLFMILVFVLMFSTFKPFFLSTYKTSMFFLSLFTFSLLKVLVFLEQMVKLWFEKSWLEIFSLKFMKGNLFTLSLKSLFFTSKTYPLLIFLVFFLFILLMF